MHDNRKYGWGNSNHFRGKQEEYPIRELHYSKGTDILHSDETRSPDDI